MGTPGPDKGPLTSIAMFFFRGWSRSGGRRSRGRSRKSRSFWKSDPDRSDPQIPDCGGGDGMRRVGTGCWVWGVGGWAWSGASKGRREAIAGDWEEGEIAGWMDLRWSGWGAGSWGESRGSLRG